MINNLFLEAGKDIRIGFLAKPLSLDKIQAAKIQTLIATWNNSNGCNLLALSVQILEELIGSVVYFIRTLL